MWKEGRPVKQGDLVRITLEGKSQHYRAKRSVKNLGDLRLCDLQHDPVTDANAMLSRVCGDDLSICKDCNGSGESGPDQTCWTCNGSGSDVTPPSTP